ncbi:Armadillo repeat-containing protein 6 homolog-like Protein [Tribolium castaneum]|uniref:Armadillo repeat-containing protein 6 homolog-like Protein n=1 Tax=Tribolium castaneum TaxID=7070 RepID=D6WQL0_TRICA|nr:Armadillo repeat-containing protein 6 homolog-like Protein [Tribolium castaneum]
MVLVISQQTFDEAVQENMNDLGLSQEEAVAEAIAQFESQGVDLSQIITDPESFRNLSATIKKLAEFQDKRLTPECIELLHALKKECDKGLPHRVQAGKDGAYNVILDILLKSHAQKDITEAAIKAMVSLMTKQPDLLDERGVLVILSNLDKGEPETQRFVLKWCKECCVMHEMNRQKLIELNIVNKLSKLLKEGNSHILRDTLLVLRALTLDDDVRVEFGRAHEHARIIATETLTPLIGLIQKFQAEDILVNDLILTLSALLVRNEFCKQVDEVGGIELISEVVTAFLNNDKVVRQCFKFLKALAGNDECKVHIIQKGLAPIISDALNAHQDNVPTAVGGLSCVAALCLRSPDNSKALFEAALPEVIIAIMKKHPNDKLVQKTASWAIRNMVSRSRYQNGHFLELGVEELLKNNLVKFKEFEYDTKAALRDLEVKVDLKEEWTGKGGKITSGTSLSMDRK